MSLLDLYGLEASTTSMSLKYTARVGRMLISATLAVLEPVVRFTLTTLAILGAFVTIVFGFLMATKGFPIWFMLGMSVGCFLLLAVYYAIMRSFGPVGDEPGLG